MSEREVVHADLEKFKGDKSALMQHYGEQLQKIVAEHGGNISDIPMNSDNRYHKIQEQIRFLGAMSQAELNAARLGPDEIEKKKLSEKEKLKQQKE